MFRKITSIAAALALFSVLAFATPTALTPVTLKQNNYAVQASDLTVALSTCDASNGNTFPATGQEILLVVNGDSAPHTFTVTSVADSLGRTDSTLTGYSVAATTTSAVQMKYLAGWANSSQLVTLACNSTMLKFAVIRYN